MAWIVKHNLLRTIDLGFVYAMEFPATGNKFISRALGYGAKPCKAHVLSSGKVVNMAYL